jgi:hypothetical protein
MIRDTKLQQVRRLGGEFFLYQQVALCITHHPSWNLI